MFSKILKSKARKRILEILFDGSRQKYYLRELSEMLQYSAGSLQRELTGLEEDGILLSEKVGNMKFFSLNKKSPLVGELRRYMQKIEQEPAPAEAKAPKAPVKRAIFDKEPVPEKTPIKVEVFQNKKEDPKPVDPLRIEIL